MKKLLLFYLILFGSIYSVPIFGVEDYALQACDGKKVGDSCTGWGGDPGE